MPKRRMIGIAAATLTVLLPLAARQPESAQDVWQPFKFFVGQWEGRGEGESGISQGRQEWEFVLGGKYLQVKNEARFEQTFGLAPPGKEMACYSKGVMARKGAPRPAAKERKKSVRTSPDYEVQLSLDMTSPFVSDGRQSLATVSFKVVFPSVNFEFDPDENPLLGRCQVNSGKGKGAFSRLALNDVQKGEERLSPRFLSARPLEFSAVLTIESEPMAEDEAAARSRTAPEKVRLSFWTEWEKTPIRWGSELGSASLPDLKIFFEVPYRNLIQGKRFSVMLPYEGHFPEDKGTWKIEMRPASKKK